MPDQGLQWQENNPLPERGVKDAQESDAGGIRAENPGSGMNRFKSVRRQKRQLIRRPAAFRANGQQDGAMQAPGNPME